MKKVAALLAIFLFLGIAPASAAITLPYSDGFESYTVGQEPPLPWFTLAVGKGTVTGSQAYSGTQSLVVSGGSSASQTCVVDLGQSYPDKIGYEAWVKIDSPNSGIFVGFFEQFGGQAPQYNNVNFSSNGKVYFKAGQDIIIKPSYPLGVWNHARAEIDFSSLSAKVWINGELFSGLPAVPKNTTYQGTPFQLKKLGVCHQTVAAVYVDDFLVSEWEGCSPISKEWRNILQTNTQVRAIVVDPVTPDTLYAATYYGGVFKSADGGISWIAINSGLPDDYVGSLVIDPENPNTLYVGTWCSGVFKSTDGGTSWIAMNSGLTNTDITAFAIDPITPTTLYAGTYFGGVFKSTNGGMSWIAINSGLGNRFIYSLAIDPKTPDTIYAGTWAYGIFKSTNGGMNWTSINSGLSDTNVQALVINPVTPNTLYAGTWGGVFKSTDGGMNWGAMNSGLTDLYVFSLKMDPVTPTTLYAGTLSLGLFTTASNEPPRVSARENITISSEDQAVTTIIGTASDPNGDPLTYRWFEGSTELSSWQPVGPNGEACLDLSQVPLLSIGEHTLTLEVDDGECPVRDEMILTIGNSAPHPAPTGGGVYSYGSPVTLGGQASDFDGDWLDYEWREATETIFSGQVQTIYQGTPVALPDHDLSNLGLGEHNIVLCVNDNVNSPVCKDISVSIIDTSAPSIAPVSSTTILWPPNHRMVDISIVANASDNSGGPVTLAAAVASKEPEDGLGNGDTAPDWTEPVIDQVNGIITLQLRAERSGSGSGRVYTITITATDTSGNSSQANVQIIVPHDKRKK